jgi:hypothetical protein
MNTGGYTASGYSLLAKVAKMNGMEINVFICMYVHIYIHIQICICNVPPPSYAGLSDLPVFFFNFSISGPHILMSVLRYTHIHVHICIHVHVFIYLDVKVAIVP